MPGAGESAEARPVLFAPEEEAEPLAAPAGGPAASGENPEADVHMEEAAEEHAKPVVIRAPHMPSAAEMEEHSVTGHVSYRSWRPICLAGS